MLFEWNEQTIRWQLEAAEYTGYAQRMAELLLPKIPMRSTLCDIGCGMALVDFALARHIDRITCVDINPAAVGFVREYALQQRTDNLSAVLANGMVLEGHWDTVIALFHGELESKCINYLRKANDRLILVTHRNRVGSFGPKGYQSVKYYNTDWVSGWLSEQGFVFERETGALEFGQPHRSLEDAVASTAAYCRIAPLEAIRENVRQTVTETGRTDFPYYTPKERQFSIFVIPRKENEHLL